MVGLKKSGDQVAKIGDEKSGGENQKSKIVVVTDNAGKETR
jgi:hypothetical protein